MKLDKNLSTEEASHEIGLILGKVLRIGVYLSCIIAAIGGVIYMFYDKIPLPNYKATGDATFEGTATNLRGFKDIFAGVLNFDGASIIQLGVIVLIATPVIRVALSIFTFLYEKDYLYVVITIIVLSIIMFNMFFGLH